jgi:4-hydroxyphenylpyruvate dioxygenase
VTPPRLSLDTVTVKQAPLARRFSAAAAAGFAGLEVWGHEVQAGVDGLRRLAADHGLAVEGVCPGPDIYRWHDEWDGALEATLDATLPLYASAGARFVVVPVMSEEGTLDRTADHFRRLCARAAGHGLAVGLEPIGHVRKLCRVADAAAIVADSRGAGAAGLVLDVFHFFRGRNRLDVLQRVDPGLILAVHLDDAMDLPLDELVGYRHRVFPGHGIFDVTGFCAAVRERGYAGPYIVELCNEQYWRADPAWVCATAATAARQVLERAGVA